jgi:RNA recognition motif-containing protein
MNIFVAKLSSRTKSEDLEQMFGEFGQVTSAKVIMDRETGYSKRYGFVEMSNDDEATTAIENLDDKEFDGSHIVVKKARPREESGGKGGGGRQFRQNRR